MDHFLAYKRDEFLRNPGQNQAVDYGVQIVKAQHAHQHARWQLIGIYHLDESENNGNHNLYFEFLDQNGRRVGDENLAWTWEGRQDWEPAPPVSGDKPPNEVPNLVLWAGQVVSARVLDAPSDSIANVHTGHLDEPPGNTRFHHSFYVVWQWLAEDVGPEPPENEIELALNELYAARESINRAIQTLEDLNP